MRHRYPFPWLCSYIVIELGARDLYLVSTRVERERGTFIFSASVNAMAYRKSIGGNGNLRLPSNLPRWIPLVVAKGQASATPPTPHSRVL